MLNKSALSLLIATFLFVNPLLLFAADPGPSSSKPIVFEKRKLKIGKKTIEVELADTLEKSAQGLMFRTSLADGKGMLFIFPDEQIRSFWMKNTFVPLAIGYFNAKKELVDVHEMAATQSEMQKDYPTYVSKEPAKFALEVPSGWFSKNKVVLKQKFNLL